MRSAESGQVLVIVAGGIIGLLAIAALVLEGGTMLLTRRDGQNAADLSSVAGARIVALHYTRPTDPGNDTQDDVYHAIEGNLDLNNCGPVTSTPCTWTATFVGAPGTGTGLVDVSAVTETTAAIPANVLGVRVDVTQTPGTIVGRVLGLVSWTVSTEGTAITEKAGGPAGTTLPIAICGWKNTAGTDCVQASNSPSNAVVFQKGQIYDLTDGKDAPGGFGWLSWDGSNSAGALADSICSPNNPDFSLDTPYDSPGSYGGTIGTNPATGETWFPIDPGKSNSSSVRACLDGWINSGATILVPIYDLVTGNGNNAAYHITGVAAFVLTSREQPAVDNIQGYFVEYYPLAGVPGGAGSVGPDPGDATYFVGLVK